ncbi:MULTISPECIES: MFS transporter [Thermocrispum]|uniref:MFS transporter n=1 Tax=Thermocrispum agreste TaxID=37925 RepID=A0A2W4IZ46_9PSEU|nr:MULTISPECIES: MFS transporter [Thermocrispum]PZM92042.1 MAG: MFS transporter [Thermocrispum agreste]
MNTSDATNGGGISARERRRVVAATVVGTTVEWYDFFIYSSAAALVLPTLFFEGLSGPAATIVGFTTVGISFLFRPFGAFLAGHLGDRYGRRVVLVFTLVLMGASTALIGVLPTYETAGAIAPILLMLLRVLQGISAGGEWGGAALMACEHAPVDKRGLFGAGPQIGVPLGLIGSAGAMAIMSQIAPGDEFLEWGWRVPFLLSVVLIGVGYYVRRKVEESPVFTEIKRRAAQSKTPIVQLFRRHTVLVLLAALVFAGNNSVGYMTTGPFLQNYTINPDGPLGLPRADVLWMVVGGAVVWLISTLVAGWVSDKMGRRNTFVLGWVLQAAGVLALFPLIHLGSIASVFAAFAALSVGLGFTYGPVSAYYAELFPASIRFSGVSIAYAIGSIAGGAFASTIAQALLEATGSTGSVTMYLLGMTAVGLVATLLIRDRSGIPLGADHEDVQAASPILGASRA